VSLLLPRGRTQPVTPENVQGESIDASSTHAGAVASCEDSARDRSVADCQLQQTAVKKEKDPDSKATPTLLAANKVLAGAPATNSTGSETDLGAAGEGGLDTALGKRTRKPTSKAIEVEASSAEPKHETPSAVPKTPPSIVVSSNPEADKIVLLRGPQNRVWMDGRWHRRTMDGRLVLVERRSGLGSPSTRASSAPRASENSKSATTAGELRRRASVRESHGRGGAGPATGPLRSRPREMHPRAQRPAAVGRKMVKQTGAMAGDCWQGSRQQVPCRSYLLMMCPALC